MELETLEKNPELINNIFTRSAIPAIESKKEDFIIKFTSNPNGESTAVKIITLENKMLIKIKVEISYDRFDDDYGIKTIEIKKLSLYDNLGYKINLPETDKLLLKNEVRGFILVDI